MKNNYYKEHLATCEGSGQNVPVSVDENLPLPCIEVNASSLPALPIPCVEANAALLPEPTVYENSLCELVPDYSLQDVLQAMLDSPSPKSNAKDSTMCEV